MTPDQYAKVKEVFSEAIEIGEPERDTFVIQRCGDDTQLARQVQSLLAHHSDKTLLEKPQGTVAPEAITVAPSRPVDPFLLLKDVWEDHRQLLRRRLIAISQVMAVMIAISLLRLFTYQDAAWGYGARILALGVTVTCAIVLQRRRNLTLGQIRVAEFAVLVSIGLLAIAISTRLMVAAADRNDIPAVISIHNWNCFIWALIILVYGVFMPNHWKRAAKILIPLTVVPAAVTMLARTLNPNVGVCLEADEFGEPLPVTALAAWIAIYAAHLIDGARITALSAKRLAQYQVKRLIGEGGMGKVFEAEHLLLKRPCAIKVILPEYCADDDPRKRFESEVRATATLTHPHTIEVYDYGQTADGVFFFAMELLPGVNLRELVRIAGPLPPERAIHFVVQVCEALVEAHGAGLIHRDIKPANIFSAQRGGIYDFTKLLDFGLAGEVQIDMKQDRPSGVIAGTPCFMSPEQVATPDRVDARSDIYSLGAVAYYLVTGRPPLIGDSPLDVMLAQVHRQPEPPSTHQSAVPSDLEAVIMACLAKDPEQRIGSAAELHREFLQCEAAGQWSDQDAAAWWRDHDLVPTASNCESG